VLFRSEAAVTSAWRQQPDAPPLHGSLKRKKITMALNDEDISTTGAGSEGPADGGSNPEGSDGGADGTAGEGPADGGSNPEGNDGGADGTAGEGPADGGSNPEGNDGGADGTA